MPEVPNTYYQVASQFRDLRLSGTRVAAGAGSLRSSRVAVLPGRRAARPHATALTATEEPGLCPAGPFRRLRGARLVGSGNEHAGRESLERACKNAWRSGRKLALPGGLAAAVLDGWSLLTARRLATCEKTS